ncbi:MAG: PH domain-containing protein [Bacilli bacterium]|nr:PH domain-containing protein [Bacilli bacterium]MBQ3469066.1 PH domain-containing protein [Bacilli bacterium]
MAYLKFKPLLPRVNFDTLIKKDELDYETLDMFYEDEELFFISRGNRDMFVVTDRRILIVNYKLIIGNRREILSIPYKNIVTASVEIENADVILNINTSNVYELALKFSKPITLDDIYGMYKYITSKIY